MANKNPKRENLKPFNTLSKDERREIAQKGAEATNKKIKEKKLLKDTIQMFFESTPTPEVIEQCANAFGFNPKDLQEVITGGLIQKAMCGDAKAFEVLRDTAGQKPVNVTELTGANGEPLTVKKVYVTPEQQKAVEEHIKKAIE